MRRADLRTFVVESDRARIEHILGTDEGPFEMTFTRADGATVPVSVRSVAAPPGSKGTRVLVVRDISTERGLQRRLATADRLAAVGTLAAGTAHEINNPLAFVMSNADLLDEHLADLKLSNDAATPARDPFLAAAPKDDQADDNVWHGDDGFPKKRIRGKEFYRNAERVEIREIGG